MRKLKFYNRFMTTILVLLSAFITSFALHAEEDELQAQKTACAKNTAMEWSLDLNRCVGRAQSRKDRHDAQDCNAITDVEARKACHMNLATTKTGVTDDPEQAAGKITSGQSRSTIVNTANTIVSAINMFAKDSSNSQCMSKQIFGITALGGFLTDIMMKIQTKKKLDSLKDKFILNNKDNPYSSQVKALEFLKEEQEVIKKVAAQEKKRQMLLMIGYGAAAVTAAYETFYDSTCYKPEPKKATPQPASPASPASPAPPASETVTASADSGAQTYPVEDPGKIEQRELAPLETSPAPPQTASVVREAAPAAQPDVKEYQASSVKNGNKVHNYLSNGTDTKSIHNGYVYNAKVGANGIPYAVGEPIGKFDYNTGSWSGGKVSEVAITTNYSLNNGKISSGTPGSSRIQDISFGTGKK